MKIIKNLDSLSISKDYFKNEDYLKSTGEFDAYKERINRKIQRRKRITIVVLPLLVMLAGYTYIGYSTSKYLHQKGFSLKEIENIRFVEKEDSIDPLKFVTTPGRKLYYHTHNIE